MVLWYRLEAHCPKVAGVGLDVREGYQRIGEGL